MARHFTRHFRSLGLTAVLIAACAAGVGVSVPASAADPAGDEAKIKELQKRLDDRDALIRNLIRRVDRLEHEQRGAEPTKPRPSAAAAEQPAPAPARRAAQQPPPTPPAPPSRTAAAAAAPAPSGGPGTLEVNPEAAERALERALVQSGAALLGPWQMEFVPSLTYQRTQVSHPGQIALTTGGAVLITENALRSTQVEASALLRMGLPWESQAEIRAPYDYKSVSNATRVLGTGIGEQIRDAAGVGDMSFALTKQILHEKEWVPNLFVSGVWDTNTGATAKGVSLGTGFDELKFGVIATKRQDPLVFTGSFSYQKSFENNGILPGDQFTPAVGMLFAVSPETSLQFSQQLTFARSLRLNRQQVPGSDQFAGIFNLGVLSILAPGIVLNLNAGIGETADAPNFTIQLSVPIRLN